MGKENQLILWDWWKLSYRLKFVSTKDIIYVCMHLTCIYLPCTTLSVFYMKFSIRLNYMFLYIHTHSLYSLCIQVKTITTKKDVNDVVLNGRWYLSLFVLGFSFVQNKKNVIFYFKHKKHILINDMKRLESYSSIIIIILIIIVWKFFT